MLHRKLCVVFDFVKIERLMKISSDDEDDDDKDAVAATGQDWWGWLSSQARMSGQSNHCADLSVLVHEFLVEFGDSTNPIGARCQESGSEM